MSKKLTDKRFSRLFAPTEFPTAQKEYERLKRKFPDYTFELGKYHRQTPETKGMWQIVYWKDII